MNIVKLKEVQRGFLQSKVARRIFLLFIVCVLIPLSALAYFSYSKVAKQLYSQAQKQLYQSNKSTGMSVIERLFSLDNDLKLITTSLQKRKSNLIISSDQEFLTWLHKRFKGLILIINTETIKPLLGKIDLVPNFNLEEQKHIASGKTLISTQLDTKKVNRIFIIKALNHFYPPKLLIL